MFDRNAKLALVLACVALLGAHIGFRAAVEHLNVYLQKKEVHLRDDFRTMPRTIGSWRAVSEVTDLPKEVIEELGTNRYLDRSYERIDAPNQPPLRFHVAYYSGLIDAVPHVPDRCFAAAGYNAVTRPRNYPMALSRVGWRMDDRETLDDPPVHYQRVSWMNPITRVRENIRMPIGDFVLRTIVFNSEQLPSDKRVFGGYFFIANGTLTPTPEGVKALAFSRSDEHAYYCKVEFTLVDDKDLKPEEFVERSTELLDAMLPELMRCLPDWSEVERRKQGATEGTAASST